MPARRKTEPNSTPPELTFEQAMADLEQIVEAMEGEELPLEELIAKYEAGARLLKHCDSVLAGARKRIELITLADPSGENPSEPISRRSPETSSGDADDDHDITLF